jgi:hypothetical protein
VLMKSKATGCIRIADAAARWLTSGGGAGTTDINISEIKGASSSIMMLSHATGVFDTYAFSQKVVSAICSPGWTFPGRCSEEPSALEEKTLENLLGSPLWFARQWRQPLPLSVQASSRPVWTGGLKGLKGLTVSCGLTALGEKSITPAVVVISIDIDIIITSTTTTTTTTIIIIIIIITRTLDRRLGRIHLIQTV